MIVTYLTRRAQRLSGTGKDLSRTVKDGGGPVSSVECLSAVLAGRDTEVRLERPAEVSRLA